MKVKKLLLILCALVVAALSLFSCNGQEPEEAAVFYRSILPREALTTATKVSLGGYQYECFLERGHIKVSETRENTVYYGVLSDRGEVVLPVNYTSLGASGDFLFAEGGDEVSRHYVYYYDGRELCSFDDAVTVEDVGGGYFSVKTEDASYLYNAEGQNVLPGTHLDISYSYSICGNFALAHSGERGRTFVFNTRTSDVLLSFFDTDVRSYLVAYLGDNDFVVAVTDTLESASGADIRIDRGEGWTYYKQSVYRYTVGAASPTLLDPGRFIVRMNNKYSVGLTRTAREEYTLLEGYTAVYYYVTEGGTASGELGCYIADDAFVEKKALPAGVTGALTHVNGIAAASDASGAILLIDESGETVAKIGDAAYQDVIYLGGLVVASKILSAGVIRRGALDLDGNVVVPFEYSYISAFIGGKAVASKGGKSYILTTSGAETYIGDYSFPYYFEGFYQINSGDKFGIASFDGNVMVPAVYTSFADLSRYANTVYVALSVGSVTDVYRMY